MAVSYSATAPMFLPEDEKNELGSLSKEERKVIEDDIKGKLEFEETEDMKRAGIQSMQEAMSQVAAMDKAAYLEACANVPELVERESNPIAFLRCEQYNGEAAAKRLAEYWKQRKCLFGKTLAFQPMTMKGALSSEKDLETLSIGCMTILPNTELGRGAIFLDGSIASTLQRMSVLRVWFYLVHILTSNEVVQKLGYVLINSIKGFDVSRPFDRILAKRSMAIVQSAMPGQLRVAHACLGLQLQAIQLVAPQSKQLAGKHIRMRAVRHVGTDEETLKRMMSYGLVRKHMSHVLGGDYTQEHFLKWLNLQTMIENDQERERNQLS